ncbi:MAG: hypothetical protein PHU23_03200 [Dehalococcoidales bacterium]|nr:hypothetical protein [Dehalococcoidales bacterium]
MQGEIELAVDKMTCTITTGNEEVKQTIKLGFNVTSSIRDLTRALYWQSKGAPLYLKIGSRQLLLDLVISSLEEKKDSSQQLPLDSELRKQVNQHIKQEEEQTEEEGADIINELEAAAADAQATAAGDNHNHNGNHNKDEFIDPKCFLELSTFDMAPAEGKAVPAKYFLMGQKVECVDGDLKKGLLMLFAQFNIFYDSPESMLVDLEKYPRCDARDIMIEILKAPGKAAQEADAAFAAIPSAGDEYRAQKEAGAADTGVETATKTRRTRRKKEDALAVAAGDIQTGIINPEQGGPLTQ